MHLHGTSLVMPEPREVYAMQPQAPDVASMGLHESYREKNCRNTMKRINDGIHAFTAYMLENDRVDSDNDANIGGICTLCGQNFDHTWCACSGCICQACQDALANRGMHERNCGNKSGKVTRPLVSSSRHFVICHTCTSRRESA